MTKSIFELSKLRAEVVTQQVLSEYQYQPKVYGNECPFCQSTDFVKYSVENGKQRYRCRSCQRRFTQRPVFVCDCLAPGQTAKCQDCPQFQDIMQMIRQRSKELAHWSAEELQNLLE
jgi:Zn ribbon nucleic-acid-binding protein